MQPQAMVAFFMFAVAAAVTPGPSNLLVMAGPGLLMAFRAAGSLFLLWLAWQIASAPPPMQAGRESPPAGIGAAFLFQWVNPKSWIVGASAAATFNAAPGQPAAVHAMLMAGIFALAAAPSCALWLVSGTMMQRWMKDQQRAKWIHRAMGMLLAVSVVMLWM